MTTPTIIPGMPEDQYRAHPAFANSDLKILRTLSPAHMQHRRTNPDKDTAAKRDGRILHTSILEPHTFHSKYCVLPPGAPSKACLNHRNAKNPSDETRANIAWWDAWNETHPGMEIIDAEKYEEHMRVAEAIRNHPELRGYFAHAGESELSVFAHDPETGLPVKCRPDRRVRLGGVNVVLDLKSTECAAPEAFERSCENYGYWQGAAFYTDVCEWAGEPIDVYLLIAFEKEGPYGVTVHEVDPEAIADGRAQYRAALALAKHCTETGEWPAYDTSVRVARRPAWARGRV